eukprot:TRINITY_DN8065_c0_g1_i1.p1 TRINITY_DN8065_c0_g1~~TRINITY_DN8065_c0_g1_i1.p1  ORF type:complete len:1056 (-),score=320.01 TRINITY_DN8065_c0_g1_i1:36-3203(-)
MDETLEDVPLGEVSQQESHQDIGQLQEDDEDEDEEIEIKTELITPPPTPSKTHKKSSLPPHVGQRTEGGLIIYHVPNIDISILNYDVTGTSGARGLSIPKNETDQSNNLKPRESGVDLHIILLDNSDDIFIQAGSFICPLIETLPTLRSKMQDRIVYYFPTDAPNSATSEGSSAQIENEEAPTEADINEKSETPINNLVIYALSLEESLTPDSELVIGLESLLWKFSTFTVEEPQVSDNKKLEASIQEEKHYQFMNEITAVGYDVLWKIGEIEYYLVDFANIAHVIDIKITEEKEEDLKRRAERRRQKKSSPSGPASEPSLEASSCSSLEDSTSPKMEDEDNKGGGTSGHSSFLKTTSDHETHQTKKDTNSISKSVSGLLNFQPVYPFRESMEKGDLLIILPSNSDSLVAKIGPFDFYLNAQTVAKRIFENRIYYFFPIERKVVLNRKESSEDGHKEQGIDPEYYDDILVLAVLLPDTLEADSFFVLGFDDLLAKFSDLDAKTDSGLWEGEAKTFERTKTSLYLEKKGYTWRLAMIEKSEKWGQKMFSASNRLNERLRPNQEKTRVSKETMQRIYNARVYTGKILNTSVKTMNSLTIGYKKLAAISVTASTKSDKMNEMATAEPTEKGQQTKEFSGSAIEAGLGVWYALRDSARILTESANAAIVNTVQHKWGEEAGYAVQESLNGVRDATLATYYLYSALSNSWINFLIEGGFECIDSTLNFREWMCCDIVIRGTLLHKVPTILGSSYVEHYVVVTKKAVMVFYDKQHYMRVMQFLDPCINLHELSLSPELEYLMKASSSLILPEKRKLQLRDRARLRLEKKEKDDHKQSIFSLKKFRKQNSPDLKAVPDQISDRSHSNGDQSASELELADDEKDFSDETKSKEEKEDTQKKEEKESHSTAGTKHRLLYVAGLPLEELDFCRMEEDSLESEQITINHTISNVFLVRTRDYAWHYFAASTHSRAKKWVNIISRHTVVAKEQRSTDESKKELDPNGEVPKYASHDFLARLPSQMSRPTTIAAPEVAQAQTNLLKESGVGDSLKAAKTQVKGVVLKK